VPAATEPWYAPPAMPALGRRAHADPRPSDRRPFALRAGATRLAARRAGCSAGRDHRARAPGARGIGESSSTPFRPRHWRSPPPPPQRTPAGHTRPPTAPSPCSRPAWSRGCAAPRSSRTVPVLSTSSSPGCSPVPICARRSGIRDRAILARAGLRCSELARVAARDPAADCVQGARSQPAPAAPKWQWGRNQRS
jgi:hypothetical protein